MSAGETAALLSGASPPTATTEGPTPGMDIKGDSFIGSPVATASSSPPPVSRAWRMSRAGETPAWIPSGMLLRGRGKDKARNFLEA